MDIVKPAVAGTIESSDVMVQIFPGNGNIEIDLESSVDVYYRDTILSVIREVLDQSQVCSVKIKAIDRGALDCTIRARVATAIKRASQEVSA